MNAPGWDELRQAFDAAIALDGEARAAYLDEVAAANPALGQELRQLVAADAVSDAGIPASIQAAASALTDDAGDFWIGRTLGHWRVLRRLATGGMGAVFVAERSDAQYSQTAAIKLMAAQLISPDAIARFRAERQILANLDHRYIARLLDGGTTDEGLPFLVMEYVEGEPIDEYCDRKRLGIAARLELFRKVCIAVDYAHRQLVVHRDLKPSNILVTAAGEPKLLDFGIAKLLDTGAYTGTVAATRVGTRPMTPEYASPEQVRGQPVSIASDVYSLGVLLFRLLTGHSPYGERTRVSGELERAILEADPKRPSTVIPSGANAGEADVSALRSTSFQRLRKRLSGDVDNIVMASLHKDPERRYTTAMALADDIGRHLRNEPVAARGKDWAYSCNRFIRRNARSLTAAAAVVATLALLLTWSAVRITNERDIAERERATAERVAQFLQDSFAQANPGAGTGETITARQILETGVRRIETDLASEPAVQVRLMRVIGDVYLGIGMIDASDAILAAALGRARSIYPPDHDELLAVQSSMARVIWWQDGGLQRTMALLEQIAAAYREKYGDADARLMAVEREMVLPLLTSGELEQARAIADRLLKFARTHLPDPSVERGDHLVTVAFERERSGDNAAARALAEEALAQFRGAGAMGVENFAGAMYIIAEAERQFGRYDEAIALYEELIAMQQRAYGEGVYVVGVTQNNLSLLYQEQGRLEEAERLLRAALDAWEGSLGDNHRDLLLGRSNYAALLREMGRLDEAERLLVDVNRAARDVLGPASTYRAFFVEELAMVYSDQERYAEAEAGIREALALRENAHGLDHPESARNIANLGRFLMKTGELAEAERYLRQSLEIRARIMEPGAIDIANSRWWLGEVLGKAGRYEEAEALLSEALAVYTGSFGEDHESVAQIKTALAKTRAAGTGQ